jgi:hypothetical protein
MSLPSTHSPDNEGGVTTSPQGDNGIDIPVEDRVYNLEFQGDDGSDLPVVDKWTYDCSFKRAMKYRNGCNALPVQNGAKCPMLLIPNRFQRNGLVT